MHNVNHNLVHRHEARAQTKKVSPMIHVGELLAVKSSSKKAPMQYPSATRFNSKLSDEILHAGPEPKVREMFTWVSHAVMQHPSVPYHSDIIITYDRSSILDS